MTNLWMDSVIAILEWVDRTNSGICILQAGRIQSHYLQVVETKTPLLITHDLVQLSNQRLMVVRSMLALEGQMIDGGSLTAAQAYAHDRIALQVLSADLPEAGALLRARSRRKLRLYFAKACATRRHLPGY